MWKQVSLDCRLGNTGEGRTVELVKRAVMGRVERRVDGRAGPRSVKPRRTRI